MGRPPLLWDRTSETRLRCRRAGARCTIMYARFSHLSTRRRAWPISRRRRARGLDFRGQRPHGGERVHVVAPVHNLAALERHNRNESVVVGSTTTDDASVDIVLEHEDFSTVASMHDELVAAFQDDTVAVGAIEIDQVIATFDPF